MVKLGERIRRIRKLKRMSQVVLESKTGIKREYLSKIENAELKNPTYNTLLKICSGLGISLTDLVREKGEPQLRREPPLKVVTDIAAAPRVTQTSYITIPLISRQTAARGVAYIDVGEIEQYIVLPSEYVPPTTNSSITDTGRFRCLRLAKEDHSMSPIMEPEAVVGIDSYQTDPYNLDGELVLLRLDGEECGVRWLKLQNNYIVALPQNLREHSPLVLPKSKKHQILGRVIWCLSKFSQDV